MSTARGVFQRDYEHNTFIFVAEEHILELPSNMGWLETRAMGSLMDFVEKTSDIAWYRNSENGGWQYKGGTGYAAGGAPARWDLFGKGVLREASAVSAGFEGATFLLVPEPTMGTKAVGIAGLLAAVAEQVEAWQAQSGWARSISASLRVSQLQEY